MGRQEFAALQGVSPTTLDNWRRKVGKLDEAKSQSRSRLVPVRVQSNAGNSESLEIRVNDRWAIRVSRGFDEETLRRLLEVLAKAC